MVVYLDVLFFTNVLMDWITLLAAARLGGATVRQGRLALASLLGGLYAAGAALLPLLAALPVRILAGATLCLAAFCGERALLRLGGLYFLTAAAFAGLAAALGAVCCSAQGITLPFRCVCCCSRRRSATRSAASCCAATQSTAPYSATSVRSPYAFPAANGACACWRTPATR